jgi:hypothetical protein
MEKEGHENQSLSPAMGQKQSAPCCARHGGWRLAAVLVVIATCSWAGYLMYGWLQGTETQSASPAKPPSEPPAKSPGLTYFRSWPRDRRPDLVVLLTGQVYGYLQPCGCSDPQYGGLERRYNFLQKLNKERGWPIVAADLGDVAQKAGPQALIKYRYTMEAMKQLNYSAVGIGHTEVALPLFEALGEYALNNPTPRVVCANLEGRAAKFPMMLEAYEIVARAGMPTVAIVGVVGPSVAKEVLNWDVKFEDVETTLRTLLRDPKFVSSKPEFLVLLYQGTVDEAKVCSQKFPEFQVVQSLTLEEEPPGRPNIVGNNWVIEIGHKGRHVGLVGAYRTGKADQPFELHYESVQLGPEYKTPEAETAGQPILALMEEYAREVKKDNYLARYPRTKHPIQQVPEFASATYVGSEKCKTCHKESYKIWKASPHSHAYATLEQAKHPGLRQYDGECVLCHVTGFAYEGGFRDEQKSAHLKDNGCENCHGPGSAHIADKNNTTLHALMNPYKTKSNETPEQKMRRENALNDSCQKCHDVDNDVHWKLEKWVTGKIVHKETSD